MHAFGCEDIDGPGNRCGGRGNKNSETAVLKFLNYECGHQGLFNFRQRRLPHMFLTTSRQLLGQTPKECVPRDSFKERFLDSISCRSPCGCANNNTDEETDNQHEEKRKGLF